MQTSFHCDTGKILSHQFTADGFLRVYGRVAKVGPLVYRDGENTRTEHVSADVLFAKDSIDSLKMVPITLGHPPVMVTSKNAREYQRGMTGHSVIIDGDFLGVTMTVTDQETIDAIVNGDAAELSCGYRAGVSKRDDGELNQSSRIYNHVSAVPLGRAGHEVRVMLDSADSECWVADAIDVESSPPPENALPNNVPVETKQNAVPARRDMSRQFNIDNEILIVEDPTIGNAVAGLLEKLKAVEVRDSADALKTSEEITALKAKLDAAELAAVELTSKLDASEGKAAGLEIKVTELSEKKDAVDPNLETIRADAESKITTEVHARLDAWAQVSDRLPKDFKIDHSLDVPGIQRAYLAAAHPTLSLDGKDAAYIQGVYDVLSVSADASRSDNKASQLVDNVDAARGKDTCGKDGNPKWDMDKENTMKANRKKGLPGTMEKK
jgi:uncharacterized protein